ncbi:MAG: pitrilysin family protein [Thermoanaerobaculia bacterium]
MKIEYDQLPNGLKVVYNEDHSAPLVAINVWYHVGSKNEREGRTGFAHLFEHMLFSGSEHVGNNEHFRYVQSVGGILNGSTTFDRTNYYETLPSNYLALGLWLESDRMGFFLPALTQEKFDVQKNVVKEERRLRYDNAPYGTAFENLLELAYDPDFPYHWPTIGSMEDLDAAELDDIRQFFRTWYAPDNAVLTLVGDFVPAEAKKLVETYFADIPAGPARPPFDRTRRPAGEERRGSVHGPVQLPRLYRLYHLPPMGRDEWFAADLVTNLLAAGKASRLERALVYEQQIAQEVGAFVFPTETSGMLLMMATAKQNVDLAKLEAAMDTEIETLIRGGVTDEELTRVKNQSETDVAHQVSEYESRADLLGMFATFFDDPALVGKWPERYRARSAGELQSAAAKYLTTENRVTLEYLPAAGATAAEEVQ